MPHSLYMQFASSFDIAKPTCTRTSVAKNHKRCRTCVPALTYIGTASFFADCDKLFRVQIVFYMRVSFTCSYFGFEPPGFTFMKWALHFFRRICELKSFPCSRWKPVCLSSDIFESTSRYRIFVIS